MPVGPTLHDPLVQQAVLAAVDVLSRLAHEDVGFFAGAGGAETAQIVEMEDHYASVWGRDASFTILGAIHLDYLEIGNPNRAKITGASRASLVTLMRNQYPNGQIPNVIWPHGVASTGFEPYRDCGEAGGIDATSHFVIALREYLRYNDDVAVHTNGETAVHRAIAWLLARDDNQEGVINSSQAGDWLDSTLVRSGKTLSNNVLFYQALRAAAELSSDPAESDRYVDLVGDLHRRINFAFWPEHGANWRFMIGPLGTPEGERRLGIYPHPARQAAYGAAYKPDRSHYLSHIEYAEFVDKCDVLANVLAVTFGVATGDRARTIMQTLHAASIKLACPISTYLAPIQADDPSGMYKQHVDRHQGERWRNPPGAYHNAGIWPFIGGYYIEALVKVGMREQAESELRRLCQSNLDTHFNEWLDFYTGTPGGNPSQGWNAGGLLRAVKAVHGAEPSSS